MADGTPQRSRAWRLGRTLGFHSPGEYAALARSETATSEELEALATSEYVFVRQYVAANPRTPERVLRALMPAAATSDSDLEMLRFLCFNNTLPADLLYSAVKALMTRVDTTHPDQVLGSVLAASRHPSASDELLHELLDMPQATRRFKVLMAQSTTRASILARLARDESGRVRRAADSALAP